MKIQELMDDKLYREWQEEQLSNEEEFEDSWETFLEDICTKSCYKPDNKHLEAIKDLFDGDNMAKFAFTRDLRGIYSIEYLEKISIYL
jgi:hypothetical protein